MSAPLVGIFVGGKGRRMGGAAKGLLIAPGGEPLVLRMCRVAREALGSPQIVLVGPAADYAKLAFEHLVDEPAEIGPLGGLIALLGEAERRDAPAAYAFACDLPYLQAPLIVRLASHAPAAAAVAPRTQGRWEPFCARFAPGPALGSARIVLAGSGRSLHAVFDALGPLAVELAVSETERAELRDWDTAEDVAR
jgi:molybdopterin-guanine dinucleotide biosynthesis protein A